MAHTPASPRQLYKLASNAFEKGQVAQAGEFCKQILKASPSHAKALKLMGDICHRSGDFLGAGQYYQQSIGADPANVEAYLALARVLLAQNRANEAVQIAHRATQIEPKNPDTHGMLVYLFLRFDHAHMALDYLEHILPQFSGNADLLQYYCITLKVNEQREKADGVYEEMIKKHRIPASFRAMYETYLPRLVVSNAEIDEVREQFSASLDHFIARKPRLDLSKLSYLPLFNLAFHNRDNKELAEKYCRFLRIGAPELNYTANHCRDDAKPVYDGSRPIRIGYVSRHMHDHPVGRCYRNALLSLHKQPGMEVMLFQLEHIVDGKIRELAAAGVKIFSVPKNIKAAQEFLSTHELDILIYPDLGMDADSYYLAMARLAPYQACLTGHPDTPGIDTVDYFISSRFYETGGAQENYNETLLQVPALDTIFDRPPPPAQWYSRAELGLPEDKHLYVCPMAIQKMHPDFDDILAGILEQDENAMLVLFNDFQMKSASSRLQQRINARFPQERVLFLGWQPMDRLLSIMKTADAVLATIYFGAGTTGQYATAFGIPMVTMPGHYARSCIVSGSYALMGIKDAPVAATPPAYIDTAIRLATDKAYKENLSKQLQEKNAALFEDNLYREEVVRLMQSIMRQELGDYR